MVGSNPQNQLAPQQLSFLAGGGEMGARTRAKNWSRSLVGAIETWPQSLRTAVSICLGSRHPIVLWWGRDELTQFYNDAFISFLGPVKHPGALGGSGRDCWREIWPIMGPMLESVFATGEATWSEDFLYVLHRNLPQEEGYFTFSYSPIRGDDGVVNGIFCACNETTGRVLGERRLRTLRDLGQKQAEAQTAESACENAARVLSENSADLPFALIYLLDDAASCAQLSAASALEPGNRAAPREIDLKEVSAIAPVWPLIHALETGAAEDVSDLASRFGSLPGGPWPEPSTAARIVPIAASGKTAPIGFLVAGISPRRVLDAEYASFLDLVAGHVGASIANARAYEEERRRAEALAEIDRAKTIFFSNVSHEFRTPLTLMLGPLEEALASPAGDREQQELIDTAHRNALRLLKLVDTLLDFSRIEAGRVEATYEPVDLAALTGELASNFRSACERARLFLTVDCPELAEPVYVDHGMWEKIVLNLLSNAFKFTLEGGITVRLRAAGGCAELSVRDTGVGIPQDELPRLFERFHRIEGQNSRTHEGSGIGLALVQELVKFHGGTISVESTLGRGTNFTIRIPFGTAHLPPGRVKTAAPSPAPSIAGGAEAFVEEALRWLPDAPDEAEAPAAGDATPLRRGTRILLADDNADMRAYVSRLLGGYCAVRAVADGETALSAIRAERPDLVLADIMMPRLDGFGLIRAIRGDPVLRDLPVILLSARAGEEARIEGLEAGADDYLVKPFSARELTARIFTRLELAGVRREAAGAVRASEERLRAVFDGTYECMGLLRPDGTVIEANRASLEFAGSRREDVIGRPFWDTVWFTHTPGAARQLRRAIAWAAAGRFIRFEATLVRPSGEAATFDFSLHPVRGEDGKVVLIVPEARDITQRKRAEDALRDLNETLERNVEKRTQALAVEVAERQKTEAALQQALRLEAIGYLTGGIAHDFNNLLTVVGGHVDAIMTAADNPSVAQMAAAIERAVDRGARLTRQLLAFARRQQLQPTIVVFGQMVAEIDDLIRRAAGETVSVELDAARDLWPVLVDPAQFESALLNLTMNARDAMPGGGRVTFSARNVVIAGIEADRLGITPGHYVVVSVTDTGTGMPPEVRTHAFEPFFTTKEVDKGTGLGLSQIYGFAKQSGGTATIESAAGAGTTVSLYLPRGQGHGVAEAIPSEDASPHHGRGKTVLIVEDQAEVREVIEMFLDGLGYEILTARDGVEAERILKSEQSIDLLLTDMIMPNGVNGLDLARSARRRHGDLKIVLASGYPREIGNREDGRLGEFVFLQKPFRQRELIEAIASALDGEEKTDQNRIGNSRRRSQDFAG